MFNSPTLGKMSLDRVIQEVVNYIHEEPNSRYTIIIGSDSHGQLFKDNNEVNFVTAIVIHRTGKGGRYFWKKNTSRKVYTLRDKIYKETLLSLEVADELLPKLRKQLEDNANYELEIHLDVGNVGETRELIKELVGMVQGNGFNAKTKPASYGAFIVADKHT